MIQNFHQYSQYYDLLYSGKNYEKEVAYIDRYIRQFKPGASKILELGSGTGNHAQHFAASGYSVTGIERSEDMASISKEKRIAGFEAVIGDMSAFELDKEFDVAVSLFHSLCYLTTNEELLNCFAAVYRHLKTSGLFCFDFWYGPGVLHDLPVTRVKKLHIEHLDIIRIAETEMLPDQNIAVVNYEMIVRDVKAGTTENFKEQHPMRYLSLPELDLLCRQTGFNLLLSETFLDGGKPGINSWNVFSILQKID